MGPVRELFWRLRAARWVRLLRAAGILPVKELKDRSRELRWDEKEEGMSPEKLLCWK